jgi:hypothetical protein
MSHDPSPLAMYLQLARASELRRRPLVRDKLLVLAGVMAVEAEMAPIAALCRQRIIAHNPAHLLGHYTSIPQALADERFQRYLQQLRRHYSLEKAEHMLASLGIDIARDRAAYYTEYEYAASLLGTTPEALEKHNLEQAARDDGPAFGLREADAPRTTETGDSTPRRRPNVLWLALGAAAMTVMLIVWWLLRR